MELHVVDEEGGEPRFCVHALRKICCVRSLLSLPMAAFQSKQCETDYR